jgi:hypothetical protein
VKYGEVVQIEGAPGVFEEYVVLVPLGAGEHGLLGSFHRLRDGFVCRWWADGRWTEHHL